MWLRFLLVVTTVLIGSSADATPTLVWEKWLHLPGVLDLAGPFAGGDIAVAVHGHVEQLGPSGSHTRFASGYAVGNSAESYITTSPGLMVARAGCSFPNDYVYALDLRSKPPGVRAISLTGKVSRLATIRGASSLSGITIDTEGAFDHRVLVVEKGTATSRVFAVDCKGGVQTIATVGALLEGGIAVAPRAFGSFGGQLIAPDEIHGILYAITASGKVSVVTHPDITAGPDIGVESIGFVPSGTIGAAYVADRGTPRSAQPHPGTDSILRLSGGSLRAAGVVPEDLLVATEGAGTLLRVHCGSTCTSTVIATGPPAGHIEGHILVLGSSSPLLTVPPTPKPGRGWWTGLASVAAVLVGGAGLLALLFWRGRRGLSKSP